MPNHAPEDVVVIGAGVVGAATLYMLSSYTGLKRLVLLDKSGVCQGNSHPTQNAQTLHDGAIEHYSAEKAKEVKAASSMVARFVASCDSHVSRRLPRMLLAVGEAETVKLARRHEEFQALFPNLKRLSPAQIAAVEPAVMDGRESNEPVRALWDEDGLAVNFGGLALQFVHRASKSKCITRLLAPWHRVRSVVYNGDAYRVETESKTIFARAVVLAAGAYSLAFAHQMGLGLDYAILPVAGGFYESKCVLRGKVYRMQVEGVPFAAIHADPDIQNPNLMRFGPTACVVPFYDRRERLKSGLDFAKSALSRPAVLRGFARIGKNRRLLAYALRSACYGVPILGRALFLREVQKIIPRLGYSDLRPAPRLGGIRPQMVNLRTGEVVMGEGKIVGARIVCDVSPSPGASTCLKNGLVNARLISRMLSAPFHEDKFACDFPEVAEASRNWR
jgi:malate dehydrogenase (quinone)